MIGQVIIKGMISPDNLKKVVKNLNRMVKKGQVTVHASNSQRITRRTP